LIVVQNYFLKKQNNILMLKKYFFLPLVIIFNLLTGDNNDEVFVVTGVKQVERRLFIVVTGFLINEFILSSFCCLDKNVGERLRLVIVDDERSNNLFVGIIDVGDDCK
jgi:hypothetical protein